MHDHGVITRPRPRKRQAFCLRQPQWHSRQKANDRGRYRRTVSNKMAERARPRVGGRWDTASLDQASSDHACREYRQGRAERKGAMGRRETGNPTVRSWDCAGSRSVGRQAFHHLPGAASCSIFLNQYQLSPQLGRQGGDMALTALAAEKATPRSSRQSCFCLFHRGPRIGRPRYVCPCCLIDGKVLFEAAAGHERRVWFDQSQFRRVTGTIHRSSGNRRPVW